MNIDGLKVKYATHWDKMHILPQRLTEVTKVATRLVAPEAKLRYQAVEAATGVPWWFVAVTHEREASQNWNSQLGQGDPLARKSINVPKGRGPFLLHNGDVPGNDAWHRAALDALIDCPPYTAKWKDWSAGGSLVAMVLYNGTGYDFYHNQLSPYIFGATDQQQKGKYVADGKYNANVWDTQVGCAAMLKEMMALDPSIQFEQKGTDNAKLTS